MKIIDNMLNEAGLIPLLINGEPTYIPMTVAQRLSFTKTTSILLLLPSRLMVARRRIPPIRLRTLHLFRTIGLWPRMSLNS